MGNVHVLQRLKKRANLNKVKFALFERRVMARESQALVTIKLFPVVRPVGEANVGV